jgi:hypothetical protein
MIWKPQAGLSQTNAAETFRKIAEGKIQLPVAPVLDAFLKDILSKYPALEKVALKTLSPWAVSPAIVDNHVMLAISGDMISTSCEAIHHAFKYGLVVYDPQIDLLYDSAWQAECERQDLINRKRAGEI